MKAKRLLFLVMAFSLAIGVKAQISNTEVLFYHCYENSIRGTMQPITNPNAGIIVIRVKNGEIERFIKDNSFWYGNTSACHVEKVVKNLRENSYYYENASFYKESNYKYDSKMSNNKWTVWSHSQNAMPFINHPAQTFYYAIKNDYSEFMEWQEPDLFRNSDGTEVEFGRFTYKRYTKDQLLKIQFGGRRDFLN